MYLLLRPIDRGFEPMNPFTGLSLESSCFNHLHKRIDLRPFHSKGIEIRNKVIEIGIRVLKQIHLNRSLTMIGTKYKYFQNLQFRHDWY